MLLAQKNYFFPATTHTAFCCPKKYLKDYTNLYIITVNTSDTWLYMYTYTESKSTVPGTYSTVNYFFYILLLTASFLSHNIVFLGTNKIVKSFFLLSLPSSLRIQNEITENVLQLTSSPYNGWVVISSLLLLLLLTKCDGRIYQENIGLRSWQYRPHCARSIQKWLRADIFPVRFQASLVNKRLILHDWLNYPKIFKSDCAGSFRTVPSLMLREYWTSKGAIW